MPFLLLGILLSLMFSAGLVYFLNEQNSAILSFNLEEVFTHKQTSAGRISGGDITTAEKIALLHTQPGEKDSDLAQLSVDDLLKNPKGYDQKRVNLIGNLTAKEERQNFQKTDWQDAAVLTVAGDGGDTLVVYRGDASRLGVGDILQVDGVYHAEENALLAYNLRRLSNSPFRDEKSNLNLYRVLVLAVLWFLNSVNFLLWKASAFQAKRAQNLVILLLVLAVPFFLTGCRVDMLTVVNEDGSGTVNASLARPREDVDFIRRMPEMSAYLDALISGFRDQGIQVEGMLNGDLEIFSFQRTFQLPGEIYSENDPLGKETWFELERYQDGGDTIFRYYGVLNTTVLYENLDELPGYAVDEVTAELDNTHFSFALVLPGELTYTNGLTPKGNKAAWEIRNNDLIEIVAESRLAGASWGRGTAGQDVTVIKFAIGALFISANIIFLVGLLAFREDREGAE